VRRYAGKPGWSRVGPAGSTSVGGKYQRKKNNQEESKVPRVLERTGGRAAKWNAGQVVGIKSTVKGINKAIL